MKHVKISVVLILALVFGVPMPSAYAQTAAPVDAASNVVKNFYAHLVETMQQGDQLGFAGRYKKLEPAIKSAFNLPLMTRVAVGAGWMGATPEQQQQLTSAFSDFSVATYASRFPRYDGEDFKVVGQKPAADGVIVETKLTPKDSEPVTLNYLMKADEQGSWRIVDVFLDGTISELATRRAEFSSIVKRDGIAALVNSLGQKSRQLGPS